MICTLDDRGTRKIGGLDTLYLKITTIWWVKYQKPISSDLSDSVGDWRTPTTSDQYTELKSGVVTLFGGNSKPGASVRVGSNGLEMKCQTRVRVVLIRRNHTVSGSPYGETPGEFYLTTRYKSVKTQKTCTLYGRGEDRESTSVGNTKKRQAKSFRV